MPNLSKMESIHITGPGIWVCFIDIVLLTLRTVAYTWLLLNVYLSIGWEKKKKTEERPLDFIRNSVRVILVEQLRWKPYFQGYRKKQISRRRKSRNGASNKACEER